MFKIEKTIVFDAAHQLHLPYDSKCNNLHGHTYTVTCQFLSNKLNENGMVIDYTHISKAIKGKLDHQNLNSIIRDRPTTAENIAEWIAKELVVLLNISIEVISVCVEETQGSKAWWINEELKAWI